MIELKWVVSVGPYIRFVEQRIEVIVVAVVDDVRGEARHVLRGGRLDKPHEEQESHALPKARL